MSISQDLRKAYDDVISVFYDIAKDMTSTFDRKEIIEISLRLLNKIIDYESICFLLYNPKNDVYKVEKAINYNLKLKSYLNKIIRDGLVKWAGNLGKPFVDIEEVGEVLTNVIVPLVHKDALIGAIILHTKKDEEYFDQNRLRILAILSNQLTISFENINLYENLEKRNHKLDSLKNYMDNIIQSMMNGIIVLDNKGIVRVFNRKSEELMGIPSKKINGRNILEADIDKKFAKHLTVLINRTEKGEKIQDEEMEYITNLGIALPFGVSTIVLSDKEEKLGYIIVVRDMRESKELEELKRIDKLKDEFLSMVSHELRTPLTSIKAYTETLIDMVEDNDIESEREFLNIINEESERLTRLINDVLDLSKIEAGKMNFIIREEELAKLVTRAVKNMNGFAVSKDITLSSMVAEDIPLILVDGDRTLQVLANLISNALKFTPTGGRVTVYGEKHDDKFIKVIVEDTGVGIGADDREKIFEKFKQAENILTREAGGTGLGLPICKNIIEYYGGKIWVESEIGVGSKFIFTLPISQ